MTVPAPLALEIPWREPGEVLAAAARHPFPVFLDSARRDHPAGRFSFLAVDPFTTLASRDGLVLLDDAPADGPPFHLLQQQLEAWRLTPVPGLPPFQGGAAGVFSYDLLHALERVPPHRHDDQGFPDLQLGFYDAVVAWDQAAGRSWVLSSGYPERTDRARLIRAEERAAWLAGLVAEADAEAAACHPLQLVPEWSEAEYVDGARRVIEYVRAGDIYQANLTFRLAAAIPEAADPVGWYLRVRETQPAPFMAYLGLGDRSILSASMERFLRVDGGRVETAPIKGTRPRGVTPAEDARLAEELLASEKDRAENVMIVDLLRNDLSRVCRLRSVDVPTLCGLESFRAVHHLVSTVTGVLEPDRTAVDALMACFPGGSITGAPKIRAMEILAELEPFRRGPYCGAIGWLGFDGGMDTSIAIRTLLVGGGRVTLPVGAGITAASDPALEYAECLAKAEGIREALAR